MSIAKAIMATDPAERQWYTDQVTVNLHARRQLRGNSRVVVIESAGGELAVTPEGWDEFVAGNSPTYQALMAREGTRILDGRVLFRPNDSPRPFGVKPRKVKA